jgi:hypothetical protein
MSVSFEMHLPRNTYLFMSLRTTILVVPGSIVTHSVALTMIDSGIKA